MSDRAIHPCIDACGARVWAVDTRCVPCAGKAASERAIAVSGAREAAASAALHDAIHALYARTADRLGCSVEAAMLVLLYSPAQLQAMAA